MTDIVNINILIEGKSSYDIACAVYDDTDSLWRNTNSSEINGIFVVTSSTSDVNLDFDVNSSIDDYLDTNGIFKVSTRNSVVSEGISIDYVVLTVTYNSLTTPALFSPTSGGTGYSTLIDFDWNVSTGGTSPYTYEIMVDNDLTFGSPDVNVTGINVSNYSYTTGLTPATTYYWKVRTKDAGGAYSAWTSTQNFTTASFVAPAITTPVSAGSVSTVTPTFGWSASTGGDANYTYELMVSLSNSFATTVLDLTGLTGTSYTMTSNLTPDTHYIKVRAKDGLGNYTSWSSTITFVANPPSDGGGGSSSSSTTPVVVSTQEPVLISTPATTTTTSSNTSIWYQIGGPITYTIGEVKNFFMWIWESFVGLFKSNQAESIDVTLGSNTYGVPKILILFGVAFVLYAMLNGNGNKGKKNILFKKVKKWV